MRRLAAAGAACMLIAAAAGCSRFVLVDPLVELGAAPGDSLRLRLADGRAVEGTLLQEDASVVILRTPGETWVPLAREQVRGATRHPRGAGPDRRSARRHEPAPGDRIRFRLADGELRRGVLIHQGETTLTWRADGGPRQTAARAEVRRLEVRRLDRGRSALLACGVVAAYTLLDDTIERAVEGR